MTAGGRKYFACTYVNIRLLRDVHRCQLPIEVFYAGADEMSLEAVQYMERTFSGVTFVDVYRAKGFPAGVSMKGYQIKIFAMLLSSFEEVFWLDSDNHPLCLLYTSPSPRD